MSSPIGKRPLLFFFCDAEGVRVVGSANFSAFYRKKPQPTTSPPDFLSQLVEPSIDSPLRPDIPLHGPLVRPSPSIPPTNAPPPTHTRFMVSIRFSQPSRVFVRAPAFSIRNLFSISFSRCLRSSHDSAAEVFNPPLSTREHDAKPTFRRHPYAADARCEVSARSSFSSGPRLFFFHSPGSLRLGRCTFGSFATFS